MRFAAMKLSSAEVPASSMPKVWLPETRLSRIVWWLPVTWMPTWFGAAASPFAFVPM